MKVTVSFVLKGVTPEDVEDALDRDDLTTKTVPAGTRVSFTRRSDKPQEVEDSAHALATKLADWYGTEYTGMGVTVS